MKCFRCGYCCLRLAAVIVVDPEKENPFEEDNLRGINLLEERCPHLDGEKVGKYSCKIHEKPWFKDTPCSQYQSHNWDQPCRVGEYLVSELKVDPQSKIREPETRLGEK